MGSRGNLLVGLDIGTGSCKLKIIDSTGRNVKVASVSYPTFYPRDGWVEQDPASWRRAATQLLRSCKLSLRNVEGIGLSGQMETIVPVMDDGKALGRAILWSDQLGNHECNEIRRRVGSRTAHRITGCRIDPMHSGPKILWVKNHERKRFHRTAKFLSPKDFLNHLFTGEFVTDYSTASSSLLFDIKRRGWSTEILESLGIAAEMLPDVYPSTAVIGEVTRQAARTTGLRAGTPVVAGGGDTSCTALGCGVERPKEGFVYLGSSASLYSMVGEPKTDKEMRLITRCHVIDGIWTIGGGMTTAGSCVMWLRNILSETNRGERALNRLFNEASKVRANSDGLIFIPHLMGERNPNYRLDSRGALIGFTQRHGRPQIIRAILEGVAMQLFSILEVLKDVNSQPSSLYATGGGIIYPVWTQILSDVLGVKLMIPTVASPEATGAAILAGLGINGIDRTVRFAEKKLVTPRKHAREIYSRTYQEYRRICDFLASK